jgi:hypothetical protein
MKQILLAFLSAIVCSGAGWAQAKKAESIYTSLTEKDCQTIESEQSGAGWYRGECKGLAGYKLEVTEGDIRQSINVLAPDGKRFELDFQQNVSGAFSALGEKAEWRIVKEGKKVKPIALIVRLNANENPEKPEEVTSRLVIVKITKSAACITDLVEPKTINQNIKARELADAASDKPCKSQEN